MWAIRTVVGRLNGTAESQSSSEEEFVWDAPELPVERSAEDVPIEPNELRGSSPSSLPEATSSSPSGGQEGSGQQAASPEVSSAWPVPGPMLAPFSGDELVYNETLGDWRTHNGVDLAAEAGEPVKAAALGRVSAVYQDAVWGWTVEVSDGAGVPLPGAGGPGGCRPTMRYTRGTCWARWARCPPRRSCPATCTLRSGRTAAALTRKRRWGEQAAFAREHTINSKKPERQRRLPLWLSLRGQKASPVRNFGFPSRGSCRR